ncbi:glyoxalase superfamily protein [Parapedobacter koreensis]|uniref:glyoxalase superfamily protein n=1 Tax=Parapedobacter koreensis TaxID=332977 RepID=UPI00373FCDF4
MKAIPILRIFDHDKAVEFYIDWLGFQVNWGTVLGIISLTMTVRDPFGNRLLFSQKK